ncbi:hypothetical protein [Neorhizobium sp. DAR64872/K0K18]|uniref:hypothetical protein n=1 Tax=Neorhizobium sp. DAR64872/K0K18 TaxID=3421958 RepID=UPI003D2C833D
MASSFPTRAEKVVDEEELPRSPLERALMMEQLLTASATGSAADTSIYEYLRQEFMQSDELKNLLPSFVRTSRTLDTFWPFIKRTAASYAERREFISQQFLPLIEHLEGRNRHPGDNVTSDALVSFDADGVHAVWNKALARRQSDPEGAITIARTLLETVCKRVLDELQVTYTDKEDLPQLYRMAAKELNLAPDQHTEEPIKHWHVTKPPERCAWTRRGLTSSTVTSPRQPRCEHRRGCCDIPGRNLGDKERMMPLVILSSDRSQGETQDQTSP